MKSFKQYFFEAINGPKVIMIGGPGSGKSTYSEIISKELEIPHIYTGDMMRKLAQTDTPDGKKVKELLAKGEFAPTPIVIKAVSDRLEKPDAQKGYIFDGFPRSVEQAKKMEEAEIKYDYVINLSAIKHVRSEKDSFSIEAMIKNNVIAAKRFLDYLKLIYPL